MSVMNYPHELIQSYIEHLTHPFADEIKQTLFSYGNEHYGEIYYYSAVKLLKFLKLSNTDHFLDIGSGLGALLFQVFLTTPVASVTGVEIHTQRYLLSKKIKSLMQQKNPDLFMNDKPLDLIHGDFLKHEFDTVSVIYVCSIVFSFELLEALGKKINAMQSVRKIASFRKLPHLIDFKLVKKLHLHCTWDQVACYLYERKI
jgi:16S rRNA A1518/A1519 N6-dimethyltransferase RsmA/KsgA/DIM1 with predicted DNA glycosylase/AP lyase activity